MSSKGTFVWCLMVAGLGMWSCSTNPTTGRAEINYWSRDEEIAAGKQAKPQMVGEYGGEYANADVRAYVTEVGTKLSQQTEAENPKLPWEFTVLNSDIVNAFALPGGQVFISKGLLKRMTNEAQMAGVLGHEIGHVAARHGNQRMVDNTIVGTVASISSAVLSEGVGGTVGEIAPKAIDFGGQTLVLRYGRGEEIEADRLGMRYMSRAGYNPSAQRQVMEILEKELGENPQSEWLSTHPYPKTRIEQIDKHLSGTYKAMKDDPKLVFNEAQFKQRCLSKLASGTPGGDGPRLAAAERFGWCALCRNAAGQ